MIYLRLSSTDSEWKNGQMVISASNMAKEKVV